MPAPCHIDGMHGTIDKAGRLVIPKALREELGLSPGDVELSADGNALRVEAITHDSLTTEGEWLVIPASGTTVTREQVEELRRADQR